MTHTVTYNYYSNILPATMIGGGNELIFNDVRVRIIEQSYTLFLKNELHSIRSFFNSLSNTNKIMTGFNHLERVGREHDPLFHHFSSDDSESGPYSFKIVLNVCTTA